MKAACELSKCTFHPQINTAGNNLSRIQPFSVPEPIPDVKIVRKVMNYQDNRRNDTPFETKTEVKQINSKNLNETKIIKSRILEKLNVLDEIKEGLLNQFNKELSKERRPKTSRKRELQDKVPDVFEPKLKTPKRSSEKQAQSTPQFDEQLPVSRNDDKIDLSDAESFRSSFKNY